MSKTGPASITAWNFRGNIDDVALFGEMLNNDQLQFLVNGGSPLFTAPSVAVPEPASFSLLGLGILGLVRRKRQCRRG